MHNVLAAQILDLNVGHVNLRLNIEKIARQVFDDASLLSQIGSEVARLKLKVLLLHVRAVESIVGHTVGTLLLRDHFLHSPIFISSSIKLVLQGLV